MTLSFLLLLFFPFLLSLSIYIYSGLLGCKFRLRRHRLYHHQLRLVPVLSARDFAILAPSRPFSPSFRFRIFSRFLFLLKDTARSLLPATKIVYDSPHCYFSRAVASSAQGARCKTFWTSHSPTSRNRGQNCNGSAATNTLMRLQHPHTSRHFNVFAIVLWKNTQYGSHTIPGHDDQRSQPRHWKVTICHQSVKPGYVGHTIHCKHQPNNQIA